MTGSLRQQLQHEPHLRRYVEPGDTDLDGARERFNASQPHVRWSLTERGIEVRPLQTTPSGLATTACATDMTPGVPEP